jgi:hypothetical protein
MRPGTRIARHPRNTQTQHRARFTLASDADIKVIAEANCLATLGPGIEERVPAASHKAANGSATSGALRAAAKHGNDEQRPLGAVG